jgi:hypothetical protein
MFDVAEEYTAVIVRGTELVPVDAELIWRKHFLSYIEWFEVVCQSQPQRVESVCLLHMHLISYSLTEFDVISQHRCFSVFYSF